MTTFIAAITSSTHGQQVNHHTASFDAADGVEAKRLACEWVAADTEMRDFYNRFSSTLLRVRRAGSTRWLKPITHRI